MTGLNAEWGLAQTLDSTMGFQYPLAQSAWANDSLNYQLGETIAKQLKMVGVQINFAPRMDLYEYQPDYINYYSNRKQRVAAKSTSFVKGLQQNGIIACAKQAYDKVTPADPKDSMVFYIHSQTDTLEFYTQLQLIQEGVKGLVTNHFNFTGFGNADRKRESRHPSHLFSYAKSLKIKSASKALHLPMSPICKPWPGKRG